MDTLSHFHSLDELIRALDRERKLLGGLFQDRKRLSFRYDVARDMAAKKDDSSVCGALVLSVIHAHSGHLFLDRTSVRFPQLIA